MNLDRVVYNIKASLKTICLVLVLARMDIGLAEEAGGLGHLIEAQIAELERFREKLHEWDRSVRGFRADHNFSWSLGLSEGEWQVDSFDNLRDARFSSEGVYGIFCYSYHIPIYEGFGYLLGTSFGGFNEGRSAPGWESGSAIYLPGVVAGFVHNFNPGVRVSLSLSLGLQRINGIHQQDGLGEDPSISTTARVFGLKLGWELFVRLNWAIYFEAIQQEVHYVEPYDAATYDVNGKFHKKENLYGLGLSYHLL